MRHPDGGRGSVVGVLQVDGLSRKPVANARLVKRHRRSRTRFSHVGDPAIDDPALLGKDARRIDVIGWRLTSGGFFTVFAPKQNGKAGLLQAGSVRHASARGRTGCDRAAA